MAYNIVMLLPFDEQESLAILDECRMIVLEESERPRTPPTPLHLIAG